MPQNDEKLEEELMDALTYGNLGVCCECRVMFRPDDDIVEVVPNKKPRHKACWEKMGKPCRKAWGRTTWRPENAVRMRKGMEAKSIGYTPKSSHMLGLPPREWEGNYFRSRPGKFDITADVHNTQKLITDRASGYEHALASCPLFPSLAEMEKSRWIEAADEMDELWASSKKLEALIGDKTS